MRPSEYMDILNEIEQKYPVTDWIIDGIHVWPIIRIFLGTQLHCVNEELYKAKTKPIFVIKIVSRFLNLIASHCQYIKAFFSDLQNNSKPQSPVDVVFLTNTIDREISGNKYYNKLVDPICDHLRMNYKKWFVLERSSNNKYRIPRYNPSFFIQLQLDYQLIKSKITSQSFVLNIKLEKYDDFTVFIKEKGYNIRLPDLLTLKKEIMSLRKTADYFKRLLEILQPKIGFVTDYYNYTGMAFVLACKELKITSVDIQHGVQGEYHIAYGRWNNVPKDGYELLPTIFWCRGEFEANAIKDWNQAVSKYHRPIISGNLYLNQWVDGNNELVNYYDQQILVFKKDKPPVHILYTLQNYNIPEWVWQAIKDSPSNWFWWLRLHPTQIEQRKEILELIEGYQLRRVELNLASDLPLYVILRHIDLHVTGWSTTVIEAESFGIPSIMIHQNGEEYFKQQLESGIARQAYSKEQLYEAINALLDYKKNYNLKSCLKEKNFTKEAQDLLSE